MASASETRVIAEHEYTVNKLGARKAEKIFVRLCKLLGPTLVGVFAGNLFKAGEKQARSEGLPDDSAESPKKSIGDLEIRTEDMVRAGEALFDRLDEATWEYLRETLFETVLVDGKPILLGYDLNYRGRIKEVFGVMWFAIEVNFGFSLGSLVSAFVGEAPASPENQ